MTIFLRGTAAFESTIKRFFTCAYKCEQKIN